MFTQKNISDSMSFEEYFQLSKKLVENKDSSGENKSEAYVNYTKLSFTRMKRILKTTKIRESILYQLEDLQDKISSLELRCA